MVSLRRVTCKREAPRSDGDTDGVSATGTPMLKLVRELMSKHRGRVLARKNVGSSAPGGQLGLTGGQLGLRYANVVCPISWRHVSMVWCQGTLGYATAGINGWGRCRSYAWYHVRGANCPKQPRRPRVLSNPGGRIQYHLNVTSMEVIAICLDMVGCCRILVGIFEQAKSCPDHVGLIWRDWREAELSPRNPRLDFPPEPTPINSGWVLSYSSSFAKSCRELSRTADRDCFAVKSENNREGSTAPAGEPVQSRQRARSRALHVNGLLVYQMADWEMVDRASDRPVYLVDYFTSAVTPSYLVALRDEFEIPNDIELVVPDPNDLPSRPPPGYITLFAEFFRAGLRLPFHPYLRPGLTRLNVAPMQLNTNAYRILISYFVL
ncbi:hypothetical protein TIFTF001_008944 [Ficus carica]|uniref:Uncharacterized protein n=1 Tax=Ficus carica TaxID=3494 RepID=A0AA88A5W8_FICCA|nr:hypothetical protein TIFTF001_008944 [Ficus carica]